MRKNDFSGLSISKYLLIMDHQFDAMLYTTFSNDNSYVDHIKVHTGHIWPAGHWLPTPVVEEIFPF